MRNPIYRWKMRQGASGTLRTVHPVYKDDLTLDYMRESGEQFLRAQLSSKVDFIRDDYDWIKAGVTTAFGTVFHVFIEKSNDGTTWTEYWHGKFTITDCTVNDDDKKISVKPDVVDRYTDVMDGMEKEYNLIKLAPAIESIVVRKRPMIQVYTSGEDIVTCIVGQESFEQDASVPTNENESDWMVDHCHFSVIEDITELNFHSGAPTGFSTVFTGMLVNGNYLTNADNVYRILYFEESEISLTPNSSNWTIKYTNGLKIMSVNDTNVLWQYKQSRTYLNRTGEYKELPIEIQFTWVGSGTGLTLTADRHSENVYMRMVTNVQVYEDAPTETIPGDDITGYNRNYLRCAPYKRYNNNIQQVVASSQTPTEWGRADNGLYFVRPSDTALPIGRSNWVNTSLWFVPGSESINIDNAATDAYLLKDAYPIWSVIKVLLQQFSTVTFDMSANYSRFLYGQSGGSYSDPIGGKDLRLYLTPKSNITAGEYEKPAMKAPVTLRSVLTMLKNTYQLYWHIDSSNRLRIEHVKFYRNGQSYTTTPAVGIDLTTAGVARNGKKWAFATNEYTYDKIEMPQRYIFKWMDDCTRTFEGNPIEVNSPYVQLDKEEEVSVGDYTSDIDYLLLNGNSVSQDGFALMTVEAAQVLDAQFFEKGEGPDTWAAPIGSAYRGKTVSTFLRIYGTGTAKLVWWKGTRRVVTNQTFNLYYQGTVSLTIPQDATGIAFTGSGITAGGCEIQMTVTGMQQVVIQRFTALHERVQNYNLAFYFMQNPYWMWDMPAKSLTVNGSAVTASGVSRKKQQSVSVPTGNDDPDMLKLIKTGIGSGTIDKMQINLSSRMAKTTLRYDTE